MSKEREDGDCFKVAANIIACYGMNLLADEAARDAIKMLKSLGISSDELWLCHGLVTRATDGREHTHAWIEIAGNWLVLDYSNGHRCLTPTSVYYDAGLITKEHLEKYNATQARRKLVNYETYGPWHDLFEAKGESDE